MTSYKLVAIRNKKPLTLDLNENIAQQPDVLKTSFSDGEDREDWERSSGFRGRSQSLKNLNERDEPGLISRSKSLREVDAGEFAVSRARVAYIDSWNPVNPVGRGRIADRVKSWENSLDTEEDAGILKHFDNEMDRGVYSGSTYNRTRTQSYDSYTRNGNTQDYRANRYESYRTYSSDAAQYENDNYRDPDLEVRLPYLEGIFRYSPCIDRSLITQQTNAALFNLQLGSGAQ